MKFVLYTNALSAHQLPLAREFVRLIGAENFRYVYTGESGQKFQQGAADEAWAVREGEMDAVARREWLEEVEVLLVGGIRPIGLLERRAKKGLKTFYQTERWFKPLRIVRLFGLFDCSIAGWVRLLVPWYWRMARRFVRLMDAPSFIVLPIGVHAATDMARLYRMVRGDLRAWFRAPRLTIDRRPFGAIDGSPQMKLWGYFVEPSKCGTVEKKAMLPPKFRTLKILKLLWVGRLLNWKHVDTIVRAVRKLSTEPLLNKRTGVRFPVELTIVGEGPEKERLQRLANRTIEQSNNRIIIRFLPSVPLDEVRRLMREHDIYVLSSDATEGWGAVVSEALEEGMKVLGSFEAGASATMLPEECLFRAGDWRNLARKLADEIPCVGIGAWTAALAARNLVK